MSIGEGCGINEIEDISDAVDESAESGSGEAKVVKGVAVVSIDMYKGCRNCNAKVANTGTVMGVCAKCNTKIKLGRCANLNVVNVLLEGTDGKEYRVTILIMY